MVIVRRRLTEDRLDVSAQVRPSNPRNTAVVHLSPENNADTAPTVHVRVVLRQGQTLEYRAIDESWNSSPVKTYRVNG